MVLLGLSADEALEELIELSVDILEKEEMDADARTTALKQHISRLIKRHNVMDNMNILESNALSGNCRLYVDESLDNYKLSNIPTALFPFLISVKLDFNVLFAISNHVKGRLSI